MYNVLKISYISVGLFSNISRIYPAYFIYKIIMMTNVNFMIMAATSGECSEKIFFQENDYDYF